MMRFSVPPRPLVTLGVSLALVVGCSLPAQGTQSAQSAQSEQAAYARDAATGQVPAAASKTRYVLAVSVDGLNFRAVEKLGRKRAPNFHRLMRNGASTSNARTEVESTQTLPNHTGMVTGRRVDRRHGGHGVDFNYDNGKTVQQNAGHPVSSVFTRVHRRHLSTGLFASKTKFAMFERSWPNSIDDFTVDENNKALVHAVRTDLINHHRNFTFLHLSAPDRVGHAKGFMSSAYLKAVRRTDRRLGELIRTIRNHAGLRKHLTLVLTADHGARKGSKHHEQKKLFANYRVPFIVWGAGVAKGSSLYALNPGYRRPRAGRPGYAAAKQPIRNGNVANLALSLLGMKPLKGSEIGADRRLRTRS